MFRVHIHSKIFDDTHFHVWFEEYLIELGFFFSPVHIIPIHNNQTFYGVESIHKMIHLMHIWELFPHHHWMLKSQNRKYPHLSVDRFNVDENVLNYIISCVEWRVACQSHTLDCYRLSPMSSLFIGAAGIGIWDACLFYICNWVIDKARRRFI